MCPIVASVLGIEILCQFDLLFRGIYVIMALHDDHHAWNTTQSEKWLEPNFQNFISREIVGTEQRYNMETYVDY